MNLLDGNFGAVGAPTRLEDCAEPAGPECGRGAFDVVECDQLWLEIVGALGDQEDPSPSQLLQLRVGWGGITVLGERVEPESVGTFRPATAGGSTGSRGRDQLDPVPDVGRVGGAVPAGIVVVQLGHEVCLLRQREPMLVVLDVDEPDEVLNVYVSKGGRGVGRRVAGIPHDTGESHAR